MTNGGTTTPDPPGTPFRPYCDSCGRKFGEDQLRPLSKYCMYCGEPLLDWIKRRLSLGSSTAFAPPPTPQITPATQPQINATPRNNDEHEMFSGDSIRGGRRGRGGGITSGIGRDRARRSVTGGGREVPPVTPVSVPPVRNEEAESGRGLRVSRRLDYSMQNYYRGALGGVRGTGIVNSGNKRRRLEVTSLGSPVIVLSHNSIDSLKKDEITVANEETSPNSGETVENPPIPTDLQRDLDTPVKQFGPSPTARRSRPFREGRGRGARLRALSTRSRHIEELDPSDDETHNTLSTDSLHDEPTAIPLTEINLEAFNLPPVIDVPREYLEPVGRPSSIKDFRIWTVHSCHHEHVPHQAGEHGILYVNRGDIPRYLDKHNFGLMAMYENMDRKWYYLGQYKIAKIFTMALSQWERVSEEVKARKTSKYLVRGCAREWCKAQKVDPERGFRDAVDQGRWKFDCLVIQCIAFNRQAWRTLREVNTEASGRASADE